VAQSGHDGIVVSFSLDNGGLDTADKFIFLAEVAGLANAADLHLVDHFTPSLLVDAKHAATVWAAFCVLWISLILSYLCVR
jgi:hypothetical protein